MRLLKSTTIVALAAMSAIPALAHTGSHEAPLLANIAHWLTSPTHAALAIIGAAAVLLLARKIKRKS